MWIEMHNRWLVLQQIPMNIWSRSAELSFTCMLAAYWNFPNEVVCWSTFVFYIIYHICFCLSEDWGEFLVPYRLILFFFICVCVLCDRRWIFVAFEFSLSLFSYFLCFVLEPGFHSADSLSYRDSGWIDRFLICQFSFYYAFAKTFMHAVIWGLHVLDFLTGLYEFGQ